MKRGGSAWVEHRAHKTASPALSSDTRESAVVPRAVSCSQEAILRNPEVAGSNPVPASNDRGLVLLIHFCIIKQRIDRIYSKLQKSKLSSEDKIWVLIVTTEPLPQISRKTEAEICLIG